MIEIQGLSILYGKRKLAYPDISSKEGRGSGHSGKKRMRKNIGCFRFFWESFRTVPFPMRGQSFLDGICLYGGWNGLKRSAISRSLPRVP